MNHNRRSLINITHLNVYFPAKGSGFFKKKYVQAVDDVSLSIKKHDITGLIGESGCGKTTLGRALVLLERPTRGKILFNGKDIQSFGKSEMKNFRRSVQMIFQDPFSAMNPLQTVFKTLSLPLSVHHVTKNNSEMRERCTSVLNDVKLGPEYLDKYSHQLSGGERQRICIARAVILKPQFIIADEPTSMVDASLKGEICKLLMVLRKKHNLSCLLISHDLNVIQSLSDRIIVMYLGKVVEILSMNKSTKYLHPYSQLLAYGSDFSVPDKKILSFKGEIPSPIDPPSGCRFHPRCIHTTDRCKKEVPILKEIEPGHFVACFLFDHK